MNFSTMKTELSDRGFAFLTDARLGTYINNARAELDDTELWPYRLTTATGAAPLTIADIGTVEQVSDVNSNLPITYAPYDLLKETAGDLTVTGQPTFFYVTSTAVATYPVATGTISVRYYKIPADLTGTTAPLAPARFHKIIVDMAVREAYRDSDNHPAAESLQAQIERDLWRMREALLVPATGAQNYVRMTEPW